jgi:hypothetical protein
VLFWLDKLKYMTGLKLEWIEEQEDMWFDCVHRRKWSTYDTVCLKKYLQDPESNKFKPEENPLA